jgi:hypothetical protein
MGPIGLAGTPPPLFGASPCSVCSLSGIKIHESEFLCNLCAKRNKLPDFLITAQAVSGDAHTLRNGGLYYAAQAASVEKAREGPPEGPVLFLPTGPPDKASVRPR